MSAELSLQVEAHPPLAVIHMTGYFAQLEVYCFKSQIDELLKDGMKFIILNLGPVTFLDSAGIGSIMQTRKETQLVQGNIYIVQSTSPQVRRTLSHSSLDKLIPTFDDPAEARRVMMRHYGIGKGAEEKTQPRPGAGTASNESTDEFELTPDIRLVIRKLDEIQQRLDRIEAKLGTHEDLRHTGTA